MNFRQFDFSNKEDGLKKLKEAVELRNQMGGALYWNILNDDCMEIARKLEYMGADYSELVEIIR